MSEETVETTEEEVTEVEEGTTTKRPRKLSKGIEGNIVTITVVGGEMGAMTFDTTELPENVQSALVPFGLGHKLGDSAAGQSGVDAENAIQKVWEGLLKGDWSVRAPAAPKVSIANVKDALANMTPEDAAKARELMAQMGILL